MTNPGLMTWMTLLRRLQPRRRSVAVIHEYDNQALWFIETRGPLPRGHRGRDWSTCPGTTHRDFSSPREAIEVAEWWGYTVIK